MTYQFLIDGKIKFDFQIYKNGDISILVVLFFIIFKISCLRDKLRLKCHKKRMLYKILINFIIKFSSQHL